MKQITTDQYKEGIESLNTFMEMLERALTDAMKGVELRFESAFNWQGYQIEKYPGLKDSQYYCQIDFNAPNILEFFEYYEMTHKPFKEPLDLSEQGFFDLPYERQEEMLINFIQKASDNAKIWNSSEERRRVVPERLW